MFVYSPRKRKEHTMKEKWIFIGLLALFAFLIVHNAQQALADISSPKISGKTATVSVNGVAYKMIFNQGPFGPMEEGTVHVYVGDVFYQSYPYYLHDNTNMLSVVGLGNFKYVSGEELILNPDNMLELTITQQ